MVDVRTPILTADKLDKRHLPALEVADVNLLQGALDKKLEVADLTAKADAGYPGLPAGVIIGVHKQGTTWPARPTTRTDLIVRWIGPDPSPPIVASGTGGMLDNVDLRSVTV